MHAKGSMQAAAREREEEFIKDVMALGRHYDKGIGYTRFKGGALQIQGFRIFKLREMEKVAQHHGKRFNYRLAAGGPYAVAVDDVDGPPITPCCLDDFAKRLVGVPKLEWGPGGGSIQKVSVTTSQVGSAAVRDLMASKVVLDIWVRDGELCIWVIPPSQITNGLFEQTQKAAPGTPSRRPWPAQAGRGGGASRKSRTSALLGTRVARRKQWKVARERSKRLAAAAAAVAAGQAQTGDTAAAESRPTPRRRR